MRLPTFNIGRAAVFWSVLLDAARCSEEERPNRPIHLISPYISDIPLSLCRWSDDALRPIIGGLQNQRLSSVLSLFASLGHPVSVSTLSPSGNHIRAGPEHLQRHADFAELTNGVRFEVVDNLHLKAVLTRDAATGGSANLTINGLVRSVENITVHWRGSEEYTQLLRSGFEALQTWATPAERLVLCPLDWLA